MIDTDLEDLEIRLQNYLSGQRWYRNVNHLQEQTQVGKESRHRGVSSTRMHNHFRQKKEEYIL